MSIGLPGEPAGTPVAGTAGRRSTSRRAGRASFGRRAGLAAPSDQFQHGPFGIAFGCHLAEGPALAEIGQGAGDSD